MFGKTRQAYYKKEKYLQEKRKRLPKLGTRKLYDSLETDFEEKGIKIGRDKLFSLLKANDLLIKPSKSYHVTTNSKHWLKKHKNLIENLDITRSSMDI